MSIRPLIFTREGLDREARLCVQDINQNRYLDENKVRFVRWEVNVCQQTERPVLLVSIIDRGDSVVREWPI